MPGSNNVRRWLIVCFGAPCLAVAGLWMGGAFAAQPEIVTLNAATGPATPYPDGMRVDFEGTSNEPRRLMLEDQAGVIRLHSITVDSGKVRIFETLTGRSIGTFTGGQWSDEEHRFMGSDQILLGGLPVRGPLEIIESDGRGRSRSTVHIYFWNHDATP